MSLKFIIFFFVSFMSSYSITLQNHDYPRLSHFNWVVYNTPEWLGRFDFIVVRPDNNIAQKVKAINAKTYILVTTDWNTGGWIGRSEWELKTSTGITCAIKGGYTPGTDSVKVYNISNYCKTAASGTFSGKRYNEGLVEQNLSWTGGFVNYDGIATDGLNDFPRGVNYVDVDLDNNGMNDYYESGKGFNWIQTKWNEGIQYAFDELRNRAGQEILLFVNSGGLQNWGTGYLNGHLFEKWLVFSGTWESWWNDYNNWMVNGRSPHLNMIDNSAQVDTKFGPPTDKLTKEYYRLMRYGLCSALLGDGYYNFADRYIVPAGAVPNEHFWNHYYDEYDIQLGYPLVGDAGKPQQLAGKPEVWVRFFDNGVSIVNTAKNNMTVSWLDLAGLQGYQGHYYRFKGGQDPLQNDGMIFNEVILPGGIGSSTNFIGDGIILVKIPTAVAANIVIDNSDHATSPGSARAILRPATDWSCGSVNFNQTSVNPVWYHASDWYTCGESYAEPYNYISGGDGSKTVEFKPTINVPGDYDIYEWHGWHGTSSSSFNEATNAVYRIRSNFVDIAQGTLDQSKNAGQWNFIGTYHFNKGIGTYFILTNQGNGYVIADAVKYVLKKADPWDPGSISGVLAQEKKSNSNFKIEVFPNPVQNAAIIQLYLAEENLNASVTVLSLEGKRVATLLQSGDLAAGQYRWSWEAKSLPSGIYFCEFKSNQKIFLRSIFLLK